MSQAVRFKSAALKELDDAVSWYEAREIRLGSRFEEEINLALRKIKAAPEQFPLVGRHVRKALASKFPYAIYFTVINERVIIIAVYHGSRDPSKLRARFR